MDTSYKRCVVRMNEALYEKFRERAQATGLSISATIVSALQEYIDQKQSMTTFQQMLDTYKSQLSQDGDTPAPTR